MDRTIECSLSALAGYLDEPQGAACHHFPVCHLYRCSQRGDGYIIYSLPLMDAKAVERVQRRATKLVKTIKDLPYTDRLKYLNIPSLYYRRRRGDMIQVYKILYNIDRINSNKFFQVIANRSTRGHHLKLFKPFSSKDCRRKFFSQRVVEDWNSLPAEVVSAKSLNSFKNILDIHWQNDIYSIPE